MFQFETKYVNLQNIIHSHYIQYKKKNIINFTKKLVCKGILVQKENVNEYLANSIYLVYCFYFTKVIVTLVNYLLICICKCGYKARKVYKFYKYHK